MDNIERNQKYNAYVSAKSPRTKDWPSLFYAFLIGGFICCIGQAIYDALQGFFPAMTDTELSAWVLVIIIFITCVLTAFGVFDNIAKFAGAGTIVPITGFANSICSSAIEYRTEGIIFGTCAKMFLIAGPVIVSGVVSSVIVGIIYLFMWGNMKLNKLGKNTVVFKKKPKILSYYSLVGKKEGEGPLGKFFDRVLNDDLCGQKTFELAERQILEETILGALEKGQIDVNDIDFMIGGDLTNQIISTSFSARKYEIPLIGVYGACSTMSESLALGACLVDGGYANKTICATVSHFSTAERTYRYPLELGNQRPPVSQWTVTGSGCTILGQSDDKTKPYISMATFGKVTDYGISDVNNMGAAMAPASYETLCQHFADTKRTPDDYDLIVTGDLGKLGSEILRDLMEHSGYNLANRYNDCGHMIFARDQRTFQGGSGAGCSASVLNSFILKQMEKGELHRVLLMATGALLSQTSSQQGETIPGIAHAVVIERSEKNADNIS